MCAPHTSDRGRRDTLASRPLSGLQLFADNLGDLETAVVDVAGADDAEAAGADLPIGKFALCWSIALEIASRFFASGEATRQV